MTGALERERTQAGTGEHPDLVFGEDARNRALELARRAHGGQKDRFGREFIEHPLAVGELALPFAGEPGLVPAYLHDTVEKAGVDPAEIERLFGLEVRRMVEALGQNQAIADPSDRRNDHRRRVAASGRIEKIVYLSDRRDGIITMTELVRSGRDPEDFGGRRRHETWSADLETVGTDGIDPALIEALRGELDSLAALLD